MGLNLKGAIGDLTGLGSIANLVQDGIDKIWPNKSDEEKAQAAVMMAQIQGALTLAQGQIETNKVEAASSSFWVAGWRPAVGWTGAVALALAYWPKALVLTGIWVYQAIAIIHNTSDAQIATLHVPAFPDLGTTDLIGMLGSMLGLGAMRTLEKLKGAAPATHA